MKRLRILLSACAADPSHGSEAYFGWSAIEALRDHHEIRVITAEGNRRSVVKCLGEKEARKLFRFLGPPARPIENRMLARLESWRLNFYFHRWVGQAAAKWLQDEKFDLIHHVTYSTWRVASPLWKLGLPFVWGPLGGGELIPFQFLETMSWQARCFEYLRAAHTKFSQWDLGVRRCAQEATVVVASNEETKQTLLKLGTPPQRLSVASPAHFSAAKIAELRGLRKERHPTGPLSIFSGGNLEGRKGVALSLRALALAKQCGLKFRYIVGGGGPEAEYLRRLVVRLDLRQEVEFHDGFRGLHYLDELRKADVYLLPSLRENAGLTLIEAMLAGAVPIVADGGGPGMIVSNQAGFPVPLRSPHQVIEEIARILVRLGHNRRLLEAMSKKCGSQAETEFSSKKWLSNMETFYAKGLASIKGSLK